jgi:hypothetical protein
MAALFLLPHSAALGEKVAEGRMRGLPSRLVAWLMFWLVVPALWLLGYRRLVVCLARATLVKRAGRLPATRLAQYVASAAAWHPLRPTCLPRAVVLWWQLRRHGLDGEIRFGARTDQGRFEAHAWVEYQGEALGHPPHGPEYLPFESPALRQQNGVT